MKPACHWVVVGVDRLAGFLIRDFAAFGRGHFELLRLLVVLRGLANRLAKGLPRLLGRAFRPSDWMRAGGIERPYRFSRLQIAFPG
jgi:hypothetical protein